MKLWDKGLPIDQKTEHFTVGKDRELDLFLARHDVLASMAHALMLHETGFLTREDMQQLGEGLLDILQSIETGRFAIEEGIEDVHSQIEVILTRRYGESGQKIHTARSRNDQVLTALRLYMREELLHIARMAVRLIEVFLNMSEKYRETFLPGFTHYQIAMPSSFGLWFGAYAESLIDDLQLLRAIFDLINKNPLGSAAGFGVNLPIDRNLTTRYLGFHTKDENVVYASMGRGRSEMLFMNCEQHFSLTLNKLASDIILYSNQNFGFLTLPDFFTTGSSIMPHKKNPDIFELIRARCNSISARGNELRMICTNLISGYHRDFQVLKEIIMESTEQLKSCMDVCLHVIPEISVNPDIYSEQYRLLFTVQAANHYVRQGLPFREAYRKVAEQVENKSFKWEPRFSDINHEDLHIINENLRQRAQSIFESFPWQYLADCHSALLEKVRKFSQK